MKWLPFLLAIVGCTVGGNGVARAFVAPSIPRRKSHLVLPRANELTRTHPASASSSPRPLFLKSRFLSTASDDNDKDKAYKPGFWERLASTISQSAAVNVGSPYTEIKTERDKVKVQLTTLLRVGIPSIFAGLCATLIFPALALSLATLMNDAGVFAVLSQDSSQFVQNFLTVSGLLFSILAGQTYYFMYQQQEAVYYALFSEVTEAKSLLEQVALVCQGRTMYQQILKSISDYVNDDLKRLKDDPAVLLSARPVDDPLESIMYMTSVGIPSSVYETVRSLRQERAKRLGALQRKLPSVHMMLLWLLALIELVSFPLLGAGTQTIGGYNILTVEGCLFGVMTFGIVMTMRVVGELWRPAGGAYNVDAVLSVMVSGLEEELKARRAGSRVYAAASGKSPSATFTPDDGRMSGVIAETKVDVPQSPSPPPVLQGADKKSVEAKLDDPQSPSIPVLQQGADIGVFLKQGKRLVQWVFRRGGRQRKSKSNEQKES